VADDDEWIGGILGQPCNRPDNVNDVIVRCVARREVVVDLDGDDRSQRTAGCVTGSTFATSDSSRWDGTYHVESASAESGRPNRTFEASHLAGPTEVDQDRTLCHTVE